MNWSTWQEFLTDRPAFRRRQLNQAVFQQLITDWSMATVLSAKDRQWLQENCSLNINYQLSRQPGSGAQKARIKLEDQSTIETVLIGQSDQRRTVCLSSQVGCPLGCLFCETGRHGFQRNLTAGEIVEQALLWQRQLVKEGGQIDNVVFMGMGEPLLNLTEVWLAIEWLHNSDAFNIGWRHLAISTVGIIPELKKIINYGQQIKLAWSLHATTDQLRNQLMPVNRVYSLMAVRQVFLDYVQQTNRRIMIEYLLLNKINDSAISAKDLINFLAPFPKNLIVINLLNYNPGLADFIASSPSARQSFAHLLQRQGYKVTERVSLGQEVVGACGQLSGN